MSDASNTPLDEITRLKARLYDKQCEISDLNKKLKDTQSELQALRTEDRKCQTCNSPRPSKRARSPSIELVDGPQDIQRKPKKERKVLDEVVMVDFVSSQSAGIPSSSNMPMHETSSQPARRLLNKPTAPSTSSASIAQLVPSPPRKKRKIEIESIIPSMNVDQTASDWPERQFVPILEEAPVESNSSNLSSSSRDSEQHPSVPGPSNSLSAQTLEQPLPSPNLLRTLSDEQNSSVPEIPVVKNDPDLQDEAAVQVQIPSTLQRSESVPTSAPAIAEPSSTVGPATSLLRSEPQPQAQAQTSSRKTKKRTVPKAEESLTLPESDVLKYLDSAKPLDIDPLPLKLEVSRKFLRIEYGGSDMHFLQYCTSNPSGPEERRIVFPMLELNPCVPSSPGQPGLIFASRHEILSGPPWTLFVKRSMKPPAVWLYLGEYKCTLSGLMTAEQFAGQSSCVQRSWALRILDTKVYDVYVAMRARIALRKAGRIPVDDEDRQEAIIQGEINAVKLNQQALPVSEEDIVEAFVKGEEGIDIIRMECVNYDHDFAKDLETKFPIYLENPKEKEKKEGPESSTKARKKAPKAAVTKREEHREESVLSSSSSAPTSSSGVQSAETGIRRSNRVRRTRLPTQPEEPEDEDDSGSVYDGSDD